MYDMEEKSELVASLLKGLANAHRIRILCLLADGEKSVSQLIEATKLPQTSMSQHLLKLREEGIVDYRREHRTLFYSVINKATLDIMQVLHEHFCPFNSKQKKEK